MRHWSDLAVFGGKPEFAEELHVGRPNIGNRSRLLDRINDLLDRKWLSNNGPFVQDFERRIAKTAGVSHCIATCNATIGLEIAIRAAGLTQEVIVPSFTFVATAHALKWQGITPVFCDVNPHTHNLDPAIVESMITPRVTGIIGVHLWGRPGNIDSLERIGARYNLPVLFDAAHAFGCTYRGRMIGGFGSAEVFSFHATKFLNSFEGGAIVTNDDELAAKMRFIKNFGFAGYDRVVSLGTNGKMTEVAAAMGLTNLENMEEFRAVNRLNYHAYRVALAGLPGVHLIEYDERERCNYQYVVAEIDEEAAGLSRDEIVTILHAENVLARRYFYPGCHRLDPYRPLLDGTLSLPVTERLAASTLVLPTGSSISFCDIERVCGLIAVALRSAKVVRERLEECRLEGEFVR